MLSNIQDILEKVQELLDPYLGDSLHYAIPVTVISTLLTTLTTVLYILTATPLFESSTQILVEATSSMSFFNQAPASVNLNARNIQTQLEMVRSRRVAELAAIKINPEKLLSKRSISQKLPEKNKLLLAANILIQNMKVQRISISQLINISYSSPDPNLSAKISNSIAEAYLTERLQARLDSTKKSQQWLETRINVIRNQLNQAVLAIQKFKAKRDYRLPSGHNSSKKRLQVGGEHKKTKPKNYKHTIMELEARASTYQRIYEGYLQAHLDFVQRRLFPATSARIVGFAHPAKQKSFPKSKLILLGGVMLGFLLGLGLSLIIYSARKLLESSLAPQKTNS